MIVTLAESCCTSPDGFNLVDTGIGWWVPDCGRIYHLRSDKGLVAGGLYVLWARSQILLLECDGLVGPLSHINMAVPGQFAVYGDSNVLGFGCFLEYMAVDFVCPLDYLPFIDYFDVLAFIWVKKHLPVPPPFLQIVKIFL